MNANGRLLQPNADQLHPIVGFDQYLREVSFRRQPADRHVLQTERLAGLVGPDCHGDLAPVETAGADAGAGELVCQKCGLAYPVRDGVPIMLIDETASTGVIGLGAFLLFLWVLFRLLNGGSTVLERLAWYALAARVVAAMVDIFWVAGPNTLPFLLVGLAIGAEATEGSVVRRPALVRSR